MYYRNSSQKFGVIVPLHNNHSGPHNLSSQLLIQNNLHLLSYSIIRRHSSLAVLYKLGVKGVALSGICLAPEKSYTGSDLNEMKNQCQGESQKELILQYEKESTSIIRKI